MKNLFLLLFTALMFTNANAQFVTIPDANFVTFLQTNYPACMSGNQMDTTCADIVNATIVNCLNSGIVSIEGIQYFDNLEKLDASNNSISALPNLSVSTCEQLELKANQLTSIVGSSLPPNLWFLDVSFNNALTTLGTLPLSIKNFKAGNCPNLVVPFLHNGIVSIDFRVGNLSAVPSLPSTLKRIVLSDNPLLSIPAGSFPNSLEYLGIAGCGLTQLPALPINLQALTCFNNGLTTISNLPSSLTNLFASSNPSLTTVINLPDSMTALILADCALVSIDTLPTYCNQLHLAENNLTSIPNFPQNAVEIRLGDNNISSIPELPSSLSLFKMENNNVSCWPVFPNLTTIQIQGNPFQCIPNYVPAMAGQAYLDTMPICNFLNTISNTAGCPTGEGIGGDLFNDIALDCNYAGTEAPIQNAKIEVYDASGTLVETTASSLTGRYFLSTSNNGNYDVVVDTLNMPFTASCTFPGADSLVTISATDSLIENVDFGFVCKSALDLGVLSANVDGWVFPGQTHKFSVFAGDLSQWYGLNCAAGTGGTVSITFSGPVSYVGVPVTALTPTITGSTYTYTISDFGTASFQNDFSLNMQADTTAQASDSICMTVVVTPTVGDIDSTNNIQTFCYEVVNSYDPNDKQVFPTKVEPGYDDWLTYTIRFQNTGTAPAFNIRLEDTFSNLLDYETFEVIGYKHTNTYNLVNGQLTVYFPNIMLPDSTSNEPESKGFFQYRIKPISGLQAGTDIENTAHIFFDYNDPIITNTAVTSYKINDLSIDGFTQNRFIVFPNPSTGKFYLKMDENYEVKSIEAYSMMGQSIPISYNQKSNLTEIEIMADAKGICFINIITDQGVISKKILIE